MRPLNLSAAHADAGEAMEHIEAIMEWAEHRGSFDTTFVESVRLQIEEKRFVTDNQLAALERIRARFDI